MIYKRRLIIFLAFFLMVVIFDWLKFIFVGAPNIINWPSLIHPGWVITTLIFFAIGIVFDRFRIWQILFLFHSIVFLAAFLNQYIPFWPVLTYNCMLFNLIFVSVYFILASPREGV